MNRDLHHEDSHSAKSISRLHRVTSRQRVPVRAGRDLDAVLVSVVIPCFNYGSYLPQAVDSVLSQQDVDVEVIVVDDASTDDSLEIAHKLAEDPRVQVIAQECNQGPVGTFNRGLEAVTGEFLVRLDADDLLAPGSLARSVALAKAYPSVGLVYGHPAHFSDALPAPRTNAKGWTIWPGLEWLTQRCVQGTNVITAPEVLMRSSVVHVVGGQRDLAHSHDMEMWMRIAAFSDVGYVRGVDQAWHRDHDLSLSAREVDFVSDLVDRRDAFDVLFSGMAKEIENSRELHDKAMRSLSLEALNRAAHRFDRRREHPDETENLVAFASETFPAFGDTWQWRALRRRCRMRPLLKLVPLFVATAAVRRLRYEYGYWRWGREGV